MEKNEIELVDYIRVIWKRKKLIIVGILVCMAVAAVWSQRSPKRLYRAEAVVRVGKIADFKLESPVRTTPRIIEIETIDNLAKIIPNVYVPEGDDLVYKLGVERMDKSKELIKINLRGPDEKRGKELLNEVVEKLKFDHYGRTKNSMQLYADLIKKLEEEIEEIQQEHADLIKKQEEEIEKIQQDIKDEKSWLTELENKLHEEVKASSDKVLEGKLDIENTNTHTAMLFLTQQVERRVQTAEANIQVLSQKIERRKEAAEINLRESHIRKRTIQGQITLHQLTINNLNNNRTRMIAGVMSKEVTVGVMGKKSKIILAGAFGLMASILLAFFIEYLGKEMARKDDSIRG